MIRTRTNPLPASIHRATDGLAPPAMSAFTDSQTHRPSFTAAEPTKTLDSSTDVIVAQIYRCHMDPVQNKSSREGVGVYSATTMQVIPKQLVVKMSGEDSIHREFAVLNYLHKCHPVKAGQTVVKVEDFVYAVVGQHEHAIFMEKGGINLGDYLPQLHLEPRVEQDSIAWTLLSVCGFISDCGIVWGDVKPGNFVRFKAPNSARYVFKAVDFDSARKTTGARSALSNLLQNVSQVFEHGSGALVTPGFIAPERAEAILQGTSIAADSKQDVFALGAILYKLYTGHDLVDPSLLADDQHLHFLAHEYDQADLTMVTDRSVKTVLAEMLERNPARRKSFRHVLNHSMWNGQSSVRPSRILAGVDRAVDRLRDDQRVYFARLTSHLERLGSQVKTSHGHLRAGVQMILAAQEGRDVPVYIAMVPVDAAAFSQWCDHLDLAASTTHILQAYVGDAGPFLEESIEKDETPAHDPIEIRVDTPSLVELAPLLFVLTRLLSIACEHGRLAEIPLASGIVAPGVWAGETKNSSTASRLARLASAYQRIVTAANKMDCAVTILNALTTVLESPASASNESKGNEKVHLLRSSLKPCYDALRVVLLGSASWAHFQSNGQMVRVAHPRSPAVHWVRGAHVARLREVGYTTTSGGGVSLPTSATTAAAQWLLDHPDLRLTTNLTECLRELGISSEFDLLRVDLKQLDSMVKTQVKFGEKMRWRKNGPASLEALGKECEELYARNAGTLEAFLELFGEVPGELDNFYREQSMLDCDLEDFGEEELLPELLSVARGAGGRLLEKQVEVSLSHIRAALHLRRQEAEAEADAEAEAKRQAQAEADARQKTQAEADARRNAQAEADARQNAQAEAEAKRIAQAEAEAEAKRKAQADAEAKRIAEAEAEAEAEAKRKAQAEAERKTQPEAATLARNYIVSKFGAEGTVTSKKNFEGFSGCTAVFMAAYEGKLDVVRALVEVMGADAEAKDSEGYTSVHAAVMGGDHAELVRYLTVERGVRVDTPNSYGWTPLHLASCEGRYESLAVLLESPTSTVDVINARTSLGYTALKIALSNNNSACADLLRAHGATT